MMVTVGFVAASLAVSYGPWIWEGWPFGMGRNVVKRGFHHVKAPTWIDPAIDQVGKHMKF